MSVPFLAPEGGSQGILSGEASTAPGGTPAGPAAKPQAGSPPDPEVFERPKRRTFPAAYKLSIVRQADACSKPGEVGALLRSAGLYSSHLTVWRAQVKAGTLAALTPMKRGRRPIEVNPLARELAQVQHENELLRRKLKQAETIIEVQKKVSELLGINLSTAGKSDSD